MAYRARTRWSSAGGSSAQVPDRLALVGVVALGLSLGFGLDWPIVRGEAPQSGDVYARASFGYCHTGGGNNCVVDGDTAWIDGTRVRLADIDAPETHPPRCAHEERLGNLATARLTTLLNSGPVTLVTADRDTDRYGRKLRIVMVGGESVGERLVREGLARRWEGSRRSWCGSGLGDGDGDGVG